MIVTYHSTEKFAPILEVSMISLLVNNQEEEEIGFYIFAHGITVDTKNKLKALVERYDRWIEFIPMPDINADENLGLKKIRGEWLFDSYVRLFLNRYLPKNIRRILYLDSDVLVTDRLHEIWNMDLEGKIAGAVRDTLSEAYYSLFDLNGTASYCNSGVILFDLEECRKQRISEDIRKYVHEQNGYVYYMEQTVFNVVFQDKIKVLPLRFNVKTEMLFLNYAQLMKLRKVERFYPEAEFIQAKEKPAIVHMTSFFMANGRAWQRGSNHPSAGLFRQYAQLLGLEEVEERKLNFKNIAIHAIINRIPIEWTLAIASYLFNVVRTKKIERRMNKNMR